MRNKIFLIILGLIIIILSALVVVLSFGKKNTSGSESNLYSHPQEVVVKNNYLNINAQSYVVIDVDTNVILAAKNENMRVYPASTTKLITALTALNIYPLEEIIKVKEYKEGKVMGLIEGDELTIRDLVKAILIHSANDAAFNLANRHIKGIDGFVDEMNKLILKYGLKNTNFVNYDGIHQANHYSSAYDLAQIGRLAIKNQMVTETSQLMKAEVIGSKQVVYKLETTNELLGKNNQIKGLKTGWTPEAGGCFVSLMEINNKKIIAVVINSQYRFEETEKIVNWVLENVSWKDYSDEM